MLFHTDKLTLIDFANAAKRAGAKVAVQKETGSKIRKRKFNVKFSAPDLNRDTATWNQHGAILEQLYLIDRDMFVGTGSISQGTNYYSGHGDFREKTDRVFDDWSDPLSVINPFNSDACKLHRWTRVSTHPPMELLCSKCGITFYPHGLA